MWIQRFGKTHYLRHLANGKSVTVKSNRIGAGWGFRRNADGSFDVTKALFVEQWDILEQPLSTNEQIRFDFLLKLCDQER